MGKLWLVARHEYANMVRRRAFVLGTLGIPLLIVAVIGFSILIAGGGEDTRPLGYVDHAGLLAQHQGISGAGSVEIRAFADEDAARAALEAGEIQAYYVLPDNYLAQPQAQLFFQEEPPSFDVRRQFDSLLRASLLADQPAAVAARIEDGFSVSMQSADGRREVSEENLLNFILPFAAGFFFVFVVLGSGGYLLQAVTTEKENRTVEVMATSLSPWQFIGGKSLGLMAVAVTQMLIWLAAAVVGLLIGAQFVPLLQNLEIPWSLLGIVALFFFPSYALIAGMMTAVGSAVTELREGQQVVGILNMLFIVPFLFAFLVFTAPNSPLMVGLTLFPTTAFITIILRWSVTTVPAWQVALSWVLLVGTAILSVWVASRVFRVGMLRYGQRLNLAEVLAALRARTQGEYH